MGEQYISNPDFGKKVKVFELDTNLLEAANKTGCSPATGNLKMIYYTKAGPGPQNLSKDEANLDPETGLNTYSPSLK